jgi:hypothetical protein
MSAAGMVPGAQEVEPTDLVAGVRVYVVERVLLAHVGTCLVRGPEDPVRDRAAITDGSRADDVDGLDDRVHQAVLEDCHDVVAAVGFY